ncbi:hypothetical protein DDB_G0279797 [Dictyostelium discoideum AX4]|uniref:Countin-2 n=1 Tax=Dictyostelium discoideum TaxID=44689 RepID=CTNB_DICDI|nr:hypothetical protein DDB_G0279797 [Dictyostelium discoideum AX4]Q8WSR7.1 RecName: Full=Countin-2; Flags: Precursor [Dictyostelium discoideum]EAL67512.1 hypothetical protein DDB_G0279797 [Dictyostelium discoideum AX4]BAB84187.1 countin2 [Dictyostelium discoideum]|eukprot:XP_641512.1 hypothetical protein DDB_G0279797 [Dictyostelium discoideum AX4]
MMIKYITIAILFIASLVKADLQFSLCPTCVDFINNDMGDLEKIISGGIATSCGAVCSLLPNNIEQGACNLLCDIVGIDEFLKVFNNIGEDADPVWICEELTVCPKNQNSNATVLTSDVSPASGPHGTTFTIGVAYKVESTLGTGEVAVMVTDPTGSNGFGDAQLIVNTQPGQYSTSFSFAATPSEDEQFPAGVYQVQLMICEGSCGAKHSVTFNSVYANFTVTSGPSVTGQMTGTGSGSGSGSGSSSGAAYLRY